MSVSHPVARGFRTVYALSSDRLWFALAVALSLLVAGEVATRMTPLDAPLIEHGIGL